jgi:long-chain acyl-CoA synthetase
MNIALWLERLGKSSPELLAVAHGTRALWTYGELATHVSQIARGLIEQHRLAPGDRVAIIAKNCPEIIEILYGIWAAGLVAVPCNAKLHGAEFGYILEQSGSRLAFVSADLLGTVAPFAPGNVESLVTIGSADYVRLLEADPLPCMPRRPDDLAWLFYTSGTTGKPKGAMLTHRNLSVMAHAYAAEVEPIVPGDAILHAAPMTHGSGLYIIPHIMRGATNVVPESGAFEAEEIFQLSEYWRRMSMFAAPTMVKRMTACPRDFDVTSLRTITYGGGPMYVEDARTAFDRFGPRLAQIFGQGESPMTITCLPKHVIADSAHPRWLDRLASVGMPFACIDLRIVDAEGRPCPVGETGEIVCRGPVVMAGYWNNAEASARTLNNGWLQTGDMGALDDQGYLTLKDRSKDMIISGGTNIYPREIEEVLQAHPAVVEVSVIGRKDPEWGEIVVAYVVGDVQPAELDRLCLERIARFKRPKDYVFVPSLPKNNYGKILKTELRELDRQRVQQLANASS